MRHFGGGGGALDPLLEVHDPPYRSDTIRGSMGREAQRRVAALALVAVAAYAGATIVPSTKAAQTPAAVAAPSVSSQLVSARHGSRRVARCPFPTALRPAFEDAARDSNLPPALLYAVAKIESNLRPDVTSESGARGLLQLMPSTGAMLALDIDEPRSNVLAGARYLRQMFDRFASSDAALAAYNAGPTAVERAGGPPSPGVVAYVVKVTALWRSVAGCR
jgi:soluble lytic murein transglycosylase-like protein